MASINRVVIAGNLTRDPHLKETQGGVTICEFGVAVNSREKVGDGWQERADFFDCRCFGEQAEAVAAHLHKGSPVAVDGKLRHERWEKDGQKKSKVTITAQSVQFLPSGRRDEGESYGSPDDAPPI